MKKGTKLVCIKNDELKEYDVILGKKFSLVIGDVYTYIDRTMGDDVIGREMEKSRELVGFFSTGRKSKPSSEYYFTTLSEWREEQLNSILDD